MDIGKMKHKISVYSTASAQSAGGLTQTRTKLFDSWAFINPLNQARALGYGITENFRSHEIIIRYRGTITTNSTIDTSIFGTTKTLTIHSVINTGSDKREIKLICTEND